MKLFVENIQVCKKYWSRFYYHEPDGNLSLAYIQTIDGVGRESLFYVYDEDDKPTPTDEQIRLARFLDRCEENNIDVLVTDYYWTHSFIDDSYDKNNQHGFISFAADHGELDYIPSYPDKPYDEDNNDI